MPSLTMFGWYLSKVLAMAVKPPPHNMQAQSSGMFYFFNCCEGQTFTSVFNMCLSTNSTTFLLY